ncbi:MAG: flagellar basal body rod protein FlgB [Armatimonadota bacterium]
MTDGVADLTTRALEKALDGAAAGHRVAANNLANIETPGYTARRVSFEGALRAAVRAEQSGRETGAISRVRPSLTPTAAPAGPDGNNVSIEEEMLALGEASVRYQALTRLIDRRLQMIGTVIGDGRSG